jgi:hypothetical protein
MKITIEMTDKGIQIAGTPPPNKPSDVAKFQSAFTATSIKILTEVGMDEANAKLLITMATIRGIESDGSGMDSTVVKMPCKAEDLI